MVFHADATIMIRFGEGRRPRSAPHPLGVNRLSRNSHSEDERPSGPSTRRPKKETITITPLPEFPDGTEPTTAEHRASGRVRRHTDEIDTDVWDHRTRVKAQEKVDATLIADRYEVIERVASGGMARIYKVRHVNLGRIFALKVMDRKSDAARRIEQLFFREAAVASVMNHPNIVQVTDFGLDDRLGAYIVMEYLQGETLHARLRNLAAQDQRMHESAVLDIGLQTAEALHYMHGQNVIHCDIKSENIFLCSQQKENRQRTVVKLIDFGLSRRRSSGLKLAQAEVAGTPEYMAPELLQGSAPQPTMDVYSLGVMFYEMLTNRLPFTGSMKQVIHAQVFSEPPPLSTHLPEPPDDRLEAFVTKAMSKDPRQRQGTMGQVIFELRTLLEMRNLREGHRGRTVVGRAQEGASTDFKRFFDLCPCPLFQLDPQGRLLQANKAFRRFVGVKKGEAIGQPVDGTRLAYVYPGIVADVKAAVQRGRRTPLQRVLAFEQPKGTRVPMMCWLTPDVDDQGNVTQINGYIHPLHEP